MIKLSAEVTPNPHAAGFICRVELREYGGKNKRDLSNMAVAKPTEREAWSECAKWVQGFTSRKVAVQTFGRTRRRR